MVGRFCRVEPLDPGRHAADLHDANALDAEGSIWTYLRYGPFGSLNNYLEWMNARQCLSSDPQFHAIVLTTGESGLRRKLSANRSGERQ